jgi:hypothetical protein
MPNPRLIRHQYLEVSVFAAAVCFAFLGPEATAMADTGQAPASDAQPGFHRVGLADPARTAVAATLGYGLTESQRSGDAAHHRLSLRLAGAIPLLRWLSVGPVVDGRYDIHAGDSGALADTGVLLRAVAPLGQLRLGGELRGWVPGAESADAMARGASFDGRLLFGAHSDRWVFGGAAGYRYDRSAGAGASAPRLSFEDRLSLGLSDFDAVLLGVAGGVTLGGSLVFLEASGDLLVGRGTPGVGRSPLRLAGGVRRPFSRALSLEVVAVGSLSGRPEVSPSAPLIPIEPRVGLLAGIRYRFLAPEPASVVAPREPPVASARPEPAKLAPPVPPPTGAVFYLDLRDEENQLVPTAKVTLLLDDGPHELVRDEAGHYRQQQVPSGRAVLRVEAPGFEPFEQPVTVKAGTPLELELRLTALPPPSQVRGVVRSLNGKALAARVRVEPLGLETATDATGAFQLDLPPGAYDVVIESAGYAPQRRKVQVEPKGVVIVNADLVRQR